MFLKLFKIVPLLFLTTPVLAESSYSWGIPPNISSVILQHGTQCFAEIIAENQLSMGPNDIFFTLNLDVLVIKVTVLQEVGKNPDLFHIDTPENYFAEPQELVLEENSIGVIHICQKVAS